MSDALPVYILCTPYVFVAHTKPLLAPVLIQPTRCYVLILHPGDLSALRPQTTRQRWYIAKKETDQCNGVWRRPKQRRVRYSTGQLLILRKRAIRNAGAEILQENKNFVSRYTEVSVERAPSQIRRRERRNAGWDATGNQRIQESLYWNLYRTHPSSKQEIEQ